MSASSSDPIIGIDLGTTNSVVAVLENDQPRVIANAEGGAKTPSIVSFLETGEVLVGEIARRQATVSATRTISSVKRLMGRSLADVDALGLNVPYDVTTHQGRLLIRIGDAGYTPSQISAFILKKLKQSAEEYLGTTVTKAIITVPAYFDDLQRQATREAGRLAGLDVLRLVNEPTAAAMAYGLGKTGQERIAVYDFGGGTFDITLLDIIDGTFQVLTSTGDTHLGGDDVDELLVHMLLQQFQQNSGIMLEPDPVSFRRLKDAAEKAKCELSGARQTTVHLPFLAQHEGRPLHLETTLTREDLENLIYPLVEQTIQCCQSALDDCALQANQIDKVILVGGSTRIPLVQELVEEFFGLPPFKGINPDEIVALGAATQAGVMAGKLKEVVLLDVTPHSLGVEVTDNRMAKIVEKNSTIPLKVARLFTTTDDHQEMVAIHVLQGESERVSENRSLGKFTLAGLQGSRAGVPRVQVVFQINADGMVEVLAQDMNTQQQKSITLTMGAEGSTGTQQRRDFMSPNARRRKAPDPRRRTARASSTQTGEIIAAQNPAVAPEAVSQIGAPIDRSASQPLRPTTLAPMSFADSPAAAAQAHAPSAPTPPGPDVSSDPLLGGRGTGARPVSRDPSFHDLPTINPNAQGGGATPAASSTLSREAREAIAYIRHASATGSAIEAYRKAMAELRSYSTGNPSDFDTADAAIRILITLDEKDEAARLLGLVSEHVTDQPDRTSALYDLFLSKFPDSAIAGVVAARKLAGSGQVDDAIASLEKDLAEEKATDAQIEALAQLYRTRLAGGEDPSTQFKLVKLLIRSNRIDEAINLLQRLVNNEEYKARALKILGLCFWQKGLHYLAWQKFQQLPISEELKDILYRLSADMEDTDQLLNAKVVLQHLSEADPNYLEVGARLRKVEQLIRLESGDRDGTLTPSIFLTLKDSRFAILEEINRGSMGIVYRAKDKVLEEIVALKILNDYMTGDPVAVERFKREARAAKRLAHPNIVRIHDMFEYGSKKLLSMEYIEGQDLKKLLQQRKVLPAYELIAIAKPVCDALQYAHKLGIVHRDIKPANIMITNTELVKVTDFGIAKFLLAGHDATRSGSQIIGTPLYMSPEQIRGDQVDARSDIYSLGATLYEMAGGRPPFTEGNIEYHHLHTDPAPLPDIVPQEIAEAILKCLAKSADDRFQSTEQLGVTLMAISAAHPDTTHA